MNTLRNFFERMKEKFSGEEFHYAEKELMHFLGKVERTLEILEIWFGNFNSPNQDVTELKEYYDNMRGEFNQNVLEKGYCLWGGVWPLLHRSYFASPRFV